MNRDALAVMILFGVAAFLYSRQSQASYAPSGSILPAGESWTPNAIGNPFADFAQVVDDTLTEILSPLDQPSAAPITVDTPIEELPVFANPIPNLPAI